MRKKKSSRKLRKFKKNRDRYDPYKENTVVFIWDIKATTPANIRRHVEALNGKWIVIFESDLEVEDDRSCLTLQQKNGLWLGSKVTKQQIKLDVLNYAIRSFTNKDTDFHLDARE